MLPLFACRWNGCCPGSRPTVTSFIPKGSPVGVLQDIGMFIDYAKIMVRGGDGGHGMIAFRRERYVPKGGPSGGDGGRGGAVTLMVDPQLTTLHDIPYNRLYKAKQGRPG